MRYTYLLFSLILIHSTLKGIYGIEYNIVNIAPNTPGGARFDSEIGIPYTKSIMETVNKFIYKILQETRPDVPSVTIYISDFVGSQAYTNENNIFVSTQFLQDSIKDVKWNFTSILYHEMTLVFQWSGDYTAPAGLLEGIATYVTIKSGFYDRNVSAKPGSGDRWDEGNDITARFLEYCDSLRLGFTAALNKKMRYEWSENYFVELLGKPVDQLWEEYKNKLQKV